MAVPLLLSEFPAVSTEAWERAIREDLEGAGYAETMIWHTPEGFAVKPFYRAEDVAGLAWMDAMPGDFPYVRGIHATGGWRIREEIDAVDPEEANRAACLAVAAGSEEIAFCRAEIENLSDVGILLANLGEIPLRFENASDAAVWLLIERMKKRHHAAGISADLDWSADPEGSAYLIADCPYALVPFTIRAEGFHEKGATAVEEVGFSLAAGIDFVAQMQDRGLSADRVAASVIFSFAMGTDFFMQVAKLRTFRMVWAQALVNLGGTPEHARARIYARTSCNGPASEDPHMNTLRGTTEAMSAIVGGAESIYVAPDAGNRDADEGGRRLARNTQLILKQEAFLASVADPVGGSYSVEVLTDRIARNAWNLMQEIEAAGGYRKACAMIARRLEPRPAEQMNKDS